MLILKNKKSSTEITETLVILVVTIAAILFIAGPAWAGIKTLLFNQQKAYLNSFNNFVDSVNKMNLPRDAFEIRLKERSAIIGFSKNADKYECFNCYVGIQNRPTIIFNKPANEKECMDNACICLCNEFQLIDKMLDNKLTKFGQCSKLTCKRIEQDIANKVIIKTYQGIDIKITTLGGGAEYWKNGFLFVNGVAGANGLKLYNEERINLIVEKKQNIIGVYNQDILNVNKKN